MFSLKVSVLLLVVLCVSFLNAEDLSVGTTINSQLAYSEVVKLSAVPLKTRTKNVFYTDSTKIIKGISAIDFDKSKAKVIVTSGGVGSSFVNVRLRSQKGDSLNYQVQVFA